MNTNDEQGKYGKEVRQVPPVDDATRDRIFDRVNAHQVAMDEAEAKAATAPLLSNDVIYTMAVDAAGIDYPASYSSLGKEVRDFYENLIASGELMVRPAAYCIKGCGMTERSPDGTICLNCGSSIVDACPSCGAKII